MEAQAAGGSRGCGPTCTTHYVTMRDSQSEALRSRESQDFQLTLCAPAEEKQFVRGRGTSRLAVAGFFRVHVVNFRHLSSREPDNLKKGGSAASLLYSAGSKVPEFDEYVADAGRCHLEGRQPGGRVRKFEVVKDLTRRGDSI